MKSATKLEPKAEPDKAIEVITAIAELAFTYRDVKKPPLAECAYVAKRAAGLLRLGDEREDLANNAAIAIAKKYGLVS
jgi:hypothetical protein